MDFKNKLNKKSMKKSIYGCIIITLVAMVFTSGKLQKKVVKKSVKSTSAITSAPKDEWITLFDGKTFTGMRGYNRADMPKAWTIEDGAIKIN